MFLFGHLGVTVGIFIVLQYLVPRARINYWYVAYGAVVPDIIDKLIGRVLFPDSLASGRLIAHTLIFPIFLALIGLYLCRRSKDTTMLLISGASFLHLFEDRMWMQPVTFFWPMLGWKFPRGIPENWYDYFLVMLKKSYIPEFSYDFIFEAIGFTVVMLFILTYQLSRKKANH